MGVVVFVFKTQFEAFWYFHGSPSVVVFLFCRVAQVRITGRLGPGKRQPEKERLR
jgi:hypothetical protein